MIHLGDITQLKGDQVPVVDIVCGGSPCQDLSVAGARAGLQGERSGLFMEQMRIIKEMREHDRTNRGSDVDIRLLRPRFMVWENVQGAFSSNQGEDFRVVLEEVCRVADKTATVPMPKEGTRDVGKLFLEEKSKTLVNGTNAGYHNAVVIRKKNEEVKTYQKVTGCLGCEMAKAVNNQMATNNMFVSDGFIVRRLTPLECERLQGYPDGWTDIGEWTDSKGKTHKLSDASRYKALGNSIALPFWQWMAKRIVDQYDRETTMASLFDGIGGFPLVFQRCGCKPIWASEIEEFPMAVTKVRFKEVEE